MAQHTAGVTTVLVMVCPCLLLLLVRSQRLKLFVWHCKECMMQVCGAMHAL
jgi:hypothetical protein